MASEKVLQAIERQEWIQPLEDGLHRTVGGVYNSMGPRGRVVKNFLHGSWLGHPLHAVLTDIPVGAWTVGFVLDAIDELRGDQRRCRPADAALTVGLAGAAAAAAAGLTDWHDTDGGARRVGFVHGLLNLTAASLYAASLIVRGRGDRKAGRSLAFSGFGIALASAYLGGGLTYSRKVGVNHAARGDGPRDFVPVLGESELPEGEPRRVDAGGVPVLLVRRGGRIEAIGEVCSHMGGPLVEGDLEGDVIQCPWHGSRFSVEDGRVIDGPATHPQPRFETRVRDGQIEVRAASDFRVSAV
jgi:nitrite reductase/ring-hydroxylating ferredoxin subunit/uncharacterized membrane protein